MSSWVGYSADDDKLYFVNMDTGEKRGVLKRNGQVLTYDEEKDIWVYLTEGKG